MHSALEKNIEVILIELTSKKLDKDKSIKVHYSEFKIDESKNVIIECPGSKKPYASCNSNGSCKAYFARQMQEVPFKGQMPCKDNEEESGCKNKRESISFKFITNKDEYRRIH